MSTTALWLPSGKRRTHQAAAPVLQVAAAVAMALVVVNVRDPSVDVLFRTVLQSWSRQQWSGHLMSTFVPVLNMDAPCFCSICSVCAI